MTARSPIPTFGPADYKNLELVRQIVLHRLKSDPSWKHFDYRWSEDGATYVACSDYNSRARFVVLAQEVIWQLMMEGVLSPGMDANNMALPWFHITDYGQEVLGAERFIPHDPAGYLDDMRAAATTVVGKVAIAYAEEALRCFNSGCHVAAVLLLGVASEAVFFRLCGVIREALKDDVRKKFEALPDMVKPRHRWVLERYSSLPTKVRREKLPESLDLTLGGLYDLIRRERNDLGHPQDAPPTIDRERAFVVFRLFPSYVRDVEAFARYCKASGF